MKYFKLTYKDGTFDYVAAPDSLTVIRKYDLCTKKHVDTHLMELTGEMAGIAQDYLSTED